MRQTVIESKPFDGSDTCYRAIDNVFDNSNPRNLLGVSETALATQLYTLVKAGDSMNITFDAEYKMYGFRLKSKPFKRDPDGFRGAWRPLTITFSDGSTQGFETEPS